VDQVRSILGDLVEPTRNESGCIKHATLPAEQQAAYTDPSLPIKAQAVEEIAAFLTTEFAGAVEQRNPAMESGANSRPGSSR